MSSGKLINWTSYLSSGKHVTLFVGSERKQFVLNEDLLCDKIDFFRAAFRGPFKESAERNMELSDNDAAAFSKLIDWLYGVPVQCEEVKLEHMTDEDGWSFERLIHSPYCIEHYLLWCNLYILADKYGAEDLCETAITLYQDCRTCQEHIQPLSDLAKVIDHVYSNTVTESALRKAIASQLVEIYFGEQAKQKIFLDLVRGKDDVQLDCFRQIGEHIVLAYCNLQTCFHHDILMKRNLWGYPADE